MSDTMDLLKRIGTDGRKSLLQTWLNGQKNLIAQYNSCPRYESRTAFIYRIVDQLFSGYNREVWTHLATLDLPVREQFENDYANLLATVK